jgi:hypothetical protein
LICAFVLFKEQLFANRFSGVQTKYGSTLTLRLSPAHSRQVSVRRTEATLTLMTK